MELVEVREQQGRVDDYSVAEDALGCGLVLNAEGEKLKLLPVLKLSYVEGAMRIAV